MSEQQMFMWDMFDGMEGSPELDQAIEDILAEEDLPYLREGIIIETVRAAFGISRGGKNRKPSDEAWEWILSEDKEFPFSFEECCKEFGADPETVLEMLAYQKRKLMS